MTYDEWQEIKKENLKNEKLENIAKSYYGEENRQKMKKILNWKKQSEQVKKDENKGEFDVNFEEFVENKLVDAIGDILREVGNIIK